MAAFEGFPDDFLVFFRELKTNNNRAWFEQHKPRYQDSVVRPMLAFIEAMKEPLAEIAPQYLAIPKAHGGSMFRIYRDTRFSKDKTPYKTHAAAQFRHRLGRDVHAPGFYFHIGPDGVAMGGGIWRPPSVALRTLREFIVDNPGAWRQLRDARAVQDRGGIERDDSGDGRAAIGDDDVVAVSRCVDPPTEVGSEFRDRDVHDRSVHHVTSRNVQIFAQPSMCAPLGPRSVSTPARIALLQWEAAVRIRFARESSTRLS